jgi:Domain of unknown function (DUF5916)/Carbohydrate family 9 binding domain-like
VTGATAFAAPSEGVRDLRAVRKSGPLTLDGRIDEPAWRQAPPVGGFVQRDPDQGMPATEPTELRILFDDHALYVAARLHDSEPDRIARQLSRRDEVAEADRFSLLLDPHHDLVTGVELEVSAAGVQRDAALYDDNFQDDTWDAVWESAVAIDEGGWTVEMRIPFSQLRFPTTAGHTWGINARRIVHRKNEESWLELVPKNENGLVSRMAHLEGIEGITPGKHLELLPYASTRAEYVAPEHAGDPFNDGSRYFGDAGLDLKYGVGTNMTLVGAVNPDFGQVEVDPAVVNLSAFETFFEEKRPFFTEGSQIFSNFGRSGSSDYTTYYYPEPLLFYSRRIGRAPQGTSDAEFVDTPAATTILGAAKLIGHTKEKWAVGTLDAVTGREFARLSDGTSRERLEVEPLTNYFVGRAQGQLGRRAGVGFFGTAVDRSLDSPELESRLVSHAFVGGADGHVFLDSARDWVVFGGLAGSTVSGSREAVLRLQTAEQRYYQRPDAPHVRLDTNATSLSGWSGRVGLNKNSGNVTVNAGAWGISPGFEPNDIGFATQTDRGGAHGQVLFRKLTPDRLTRTRELAIAKWWTFNYGGECQGNGVVVAGSVLLRNYWQVGLTLGDSWDTWDDKLTRGGPTTVRPGIRSLDLTVSSDLRRRFWVTATGTLQNRNFGTWRRQVGATLNVRPWTALTLSLTPSYRRDHVVAQYLRTVPDETASATFGSRYVFGTLDQTELSIPLRLSLALSPKLSLQVYMQALLSVGDYPDIKELAAPRTFDFPVYGTDVGTLVRDPAGDYVIDPDGEGPAPSFRLSDPDFNFKSLRVNAVLRWEFRPGSAFYAVWTQRREDGSNPGDFSLGRDTASLFQAPADDVFLVKLAWWLGK